jgi:GT2 family glycosyltransferase
VLGIIILNYNTYEKTIDCINSILETVKIPYKIYLIDNKSVNNSYDLLIAKYKENKSIKIIQTKSNIGFARGNNLGIQFAESEGCEYLLFSNNDIIYCEDTINILYKTITERKAFLVGPQIVGIDGEVHSTIKYRHPSWLEYIKTETYLSCLLNKSKIALPNKLCEVHWITACSILVDAQKFKEIGNFDANTFLYYEEYILSYKAVQKNYVQLYQPLVKAIHYHGASTDKQNIFIYLEHLKSEIYYFKYYIKWNRIKLYIIWLIRNAEVLFSFGKVKKWSEIYKFFNEGRKIVFEIGHSH